jgi:dephospho-CoA kinase
VRSEEKDRPVPGPQPLIIGLTGPNAAGKGAAAAALKSLGFIYHSLSDAVRDAAILRGRTTDRDDLILTGNELRREGGAGILAELTLPKLGARDIVDSIRNPAEVEVLRRLPGFHLLGVTALPEARFERARQRQGRGDAVASLRSFLDKEAEENTADPSAQQLSATLALADHLIDNDGTIDDLHLGIRQFVAQLIAVKWKAPP